MPLKTKTIRSTPVLGRIEKLIRKPIVKTAAVESREEYVLQLVADKTTVFALTVDNFVRSTIESNSADPSVVMSNVRQFMSGMTNYLNHEHADELQKATMMEKSRQLMSIEPLKLDGLDMTLESVINWLVLKELRDHIYSLLVDQLVTNGSIQSMIENIHHAKSKSIQEFGARENLIPPNENDLKQISECFKHLQVALSPLEKLKHLLSAVTLIVDSVKILNPNVGVFLEADNLLPLMVWVLIQCNFFTVELEEQYIQGLLLSSLTVYGEGAYYLTILSSAVCVLKSQIEKSSSSEMGTENGVKAIPNSHDMLSYDPLKELKSVIKVVIPDETCNGSLLTKTLPVKSHTTTRDVCRIIAQKLRVLNSAEYYLFKLVDGQEFLLSETDCPEGIKSSTTIRGSHCLFVYKRIDKKLIGRI